MKLLHILGARPQFIKYFPIQTAIKKKAAQYDLLNLLVHTGQHYDYRLSKIFFDELGIEAPAYHLGVGSGNHGEQTALVLQKVEEVLCIEKPDMVVVYGDTNSTLGGALAAAKLHITVAHIEAGLRSFNKQMPEEINRVLTDHLSSLLFCPSETAVNNLKNEGIKNNRRQDRHHEAILSNPVRDQKPLAINVGDVMYDMCRHTVRVAREKSCILNELSLAGKEYDLLTLHRAENTNNIDILEGMVYFLNEATAGRRVIFPMHPRMVKVYQQIRVKLADHVKIIEPLGYLDLLMLLNYAERVFTDSGGMQKEAYWLKVPCITMREETEWLETVSSGWNILYRDYRGRHHPNTDEVNAYGDGTAADRIVDMLLAWGGVRKP